ncbi:hypothetical protein TPHA_0H01830 [Tetrapisispora phaffii CBS 4417]|uniref:Ams2/SPT21 N-terminal domain-containing protein n=1 Tax=Tetrapisispora phaffii (strain ATCC 24235 / CBS 4417 / NBRC 1672 / NRRL Y-8282 / UCD 70-5) TaxID=1071381 RepID=G8BX84_TETPH|nr:hypothetical protein TPHA_0H01830 [Tetrapisispora phaffii CBS 4417]CCE64388.1 hypothetical protein TPHA_0H01830 [Tetrapisispora phaffii CBS 4417]
MKLHIKIVFILDGENNTCNTYMTQSKVPKEVQIINMTKEFIKHTDGVTKLGLIPVIEVLDEIQQSSPEIINNSLEENGFDYNVYYKDISEQDEPFVTLGLLSTIKKNIKLLKNDDKTIKSESKKLELTQTENILLMGRIKQDIKQFLRQKNNKSVKRNSNHECLEIKMKFVRVFSVNCRKPPASSSILPITKANRQPLKLQQAINTTFERHTNPMPAPKAVRTQSLPVWKQALSNTNYNGVGLPTNSLAHRIYMTDRQGEQNSKNIPKLAYSTTTMKENTHKHSQEVSNDIQNRFNFINQKKKSSNIRPTNITKSNIPTTINNESRRNSYKLNQPYKKNVERSDNIGKSSKSYNKIKKTNKLEVKLSGLDKNSQIYQHNESQFPVNDTSQTIPENKENIPPISEVALLGFDIDDFAKLQNNGESNVDWLVDGSYFDQKFVDEHFNSLLEQKHLVTGASDNRLYIKADNEKIESKVKEDTTSDVDRTSPIDTLSMPLMELNQKDASHIDTSCQEQLKKLPILISRKKEDMELISNMALEDNEATSILEHSSSSPHNQITASEEKMDIFYATKINEKRVTMASSPAKNSNYSGTSSDVEPNEELSLFNDGQRESPNSHYTSTSSDLHKSL